MRDLLSIVALSASFLDHSLLSAETAAVVPETAIVLQTGDLHFHKAFIRLKAGTCLDI